MGGSAGEGEVRTRGAKQLGRRVLSPPRSPPAGGYFCRSVSEGPGGAQRNLQPFSPLPNPTGGLLDGSRAHSWAPSSWALCSLPAEADRATSESAPWFTNNRPQSTWLTAGARGAARWESNRCRSRGRRGRSERGVRTNRPEFRMWSRRARRPPQRRHVGVSAPCLNSQGTFLFLFQISAGQTFSVTGQRVCI